MTHEKTSDCPASCHECAMELPADYEACGTCGFDHMYEWEQAQAAHKQLPDSKEDVFIAITDIVIDKSWNSRI
jgi:hypothetical protein